MTKERNEEKNISNMTKILSRVIFIGQWCWQVARRSIDIQQRKFRWTKNKFKPQWGPWNNGPILKWGEKTFVRSGIDGKFSSDADWSNGWFRCVIRFSWTCCGPFFSRRCIAIISTQWNVDIRIIISNGSARRTVAPWKWEEDKKISSSSFYSRPFSNFITISIGKKVFIWVQRTI